MLPEVARRNDKNIRWFDNLCFEDMFFARSLLLWRSSIIFRELRTTRWRFWSFVSGFQCPWRKLPRVPLPWRRFHFANDNLMVRLPIENFQSTIDLCIDSAMSLVEVHNCQDQCLLSSRDIFDKKEESYLRFESKVMGTVVQRWKRDGRYRRV